MIIGNGLIAKAFSPYFGNDSNIVVFASGVSNSRETSEAAFHREWELLVDALSKKKFIVYFGTCSVNDLELANTPYVIHKKEMEGLVSASESYVIFRLPQVVGNTPNTHTLTNYIYEQIMSGSPFQIWRNAKRNFIDIDHVALIVSHLVKTTQVNRITTSVACPFSTSIHQLVSMFELVLGKIGNYTFVEAGSAYSIDTSVTTKVASQVGIDFDEYYLENLIRKYYGFR